MATLSEFKMASTHACDKSNLNLEISFHAPRTLSPLLCFFPRTSTMFALISAFVATSYIVSVLFIAFFTVCTFDKPITRELFAGTLRKYLFIVELLTSTVSEFAIHLFALKFLFTKLVSVFGGFSKLFS